MKNNKPVKLRGVMFDITERKNIEKHLQESEERFSKSILLAPIPIMVHDEDGKVINISQGWTQFSGYTPEDIPTIKIWAEKAYRDNATEVENYIAGLFDGEETIESGEFEIFSKSGEKRIWNFHTTPLGRLKSGKKIMLSIAPDITEKKKLLNELVAAKEKAEESDHLKTAFLANMSHEIRTPMNAIMGFSSLLPEEDNMENISKYSGIIVKNSEYLVRLIDDLMLYSKLQTNMLQYNPVKFNVRELFDDVLQVFKMKQQEQGIPLKIESETDLSFSINTDYDKLKQLLTNLISNAFKYTVEGSITLGADLEKDKFLFYIKDTGIGIPQKEASKVFDRFYRAGNAVDSSIGGTGLGLSIVAELATLIGGKVWFESKQGEGTTFYVSL
jgi:PAS domain S-box-containing protein